MIDFGFHNMDCMEGMKQFPDNYFDLAVCDPPYGDGKLSDNSGGGGVQRTVFDFMVAARTARKTHGTDTDGRKNRRHMGEQIR